MKLTLSDIKADIGSLGGHNCTLQRLSTAVNRHVKENGWRLLTDHYGCFAGDDNTILTKSVSRFGAVGPYSSRKRQG